MNGRLSIEVISGGVIPLDTNFIFFLVRTSLTVRFIAAVPSIAVRTEPIAGPSIVWSSRETP